MKIKIERSGGLTGIRFCNEMDFNDLPPTLAITAQKIMKDQKWFSIPKKSIPRGAADHYAYKISITDGHNERVVEFNQYNIENDLKSLLKYIERDSKKEK